MIDERKCQVPDLYKFSAVMGTVLKGEAFFDRMHHAHDSTECFIQELPCQANTMRTRHRLMLCEFASGFAGHYYY